MSLFSLSCKYYVGTYLYCHRRISWAKKSAKRKSRGKKERKLSITGANHPQQQQHKKKKKKKQDLSCDEWILNGQIGEGFSLSLSLFLFFNTHCFSM